MNHNSKKFSASPRGPCAAHGASFICRIFLIVLGLTIKDFDLIEINEAFAAQVLSCAKELQIDVTKLNIWGGATSLGHPLGASGLRIALTLARQLKATGGKQGVASACIGGGQGIALHIKSV